MKRVLLAAFTAGAVLAGGPPLGAALSSPAQAAAARPRHLVPEDVLAAFFRDLDRKSSTLAPPFEEEAPDPVPDFPNRAALAERFAARLPRIDALRARHLVGETNRGFLEHRGDSLNPDLGAMHEENTDRLALYEAVAALCHARVDDVGRLRAARLAAMVKRGVWLQDARGNWAQKT